MNLFLNLTDFGITSKILVKKMPKDYGNISMSAIWLNMLGLGHIISK
jgi:hypothetical protein